MAIGYARPQIIGRSAGRSAVACAAYRAGQRLEDQRQGITHDYERRKGVLAEGVLLPQDAPEWMRDRAALWNAVERREDRSTRPDTAQLAREFTIALPHELDDEAREYLVKNILKEGATRKGMVADYAIHAPDQAGDERNYHAHVMLTMREVDPADPDGFGNKAREWNSKKALEGFKAVIERETNKMLKRHGIEEEITFVLEEGREAQRHMGERATQLERQGIRTEIGDENRAIEARNQERAALREAAAEIEQRASPFMLWVKEQDAREAAFRKWGESFQTEEARARADRWLTRMQRRAEAREGFEAAKEGVTQRQEPELTPETHQSQGDRDPHSTAAIVGDYLDLCKDPAKDLHRWTDATHTPRRDDVARETDDAERQAEQERQTKEAEAKATRAAMIERLFQQAEERRKREQEQGRDRGRTLER